MVCGVNVNYGETGGRARREQIEDFRFQIEDLGRHRARRRRETTRRNGDTETRRGGQKTEGFLSVVCGPLRGKHRTRSQN